MIHIIKLTERETLIQQIVESIDVLKCNLSNVFQYTYKKPPSLILQSPACVILEQSMHELAKNAFDANATEIKVEFAIIDEKFIEISVIDNGHGFKHDQLGIYPVSFGSLGVSDKMLSGSKLGGAHKALIMASVALQRGGGELHRKNWSSFFEESSGAILVFRSLIATCHYDICDAQVEYEAAKKGVQYPGALTLRPITPEDKVSFKRKLTTNTTVAAEALALRLSNNI